MSIWQPVDTNELNNPRKTSIRGVDVTVYFGQDDMPVGVRGEYVDKRNRFVIEFKYHSPSESTKWVQYNDHVRLAVGQLSSRLFEVELDVDAMDVQTIRVLTQVGSVLDELNRPERASRVGLNRIDNYVAASGAFRQVQPQLEAVLAK